MEELLEKWDIGAVTTMESVPSVGGRTWLVKTIDDRCFVLKETLDLIRSEREHVLLLRLSEAGIPVPVPIVTARGGWCASDREERVFWLYPKLPGLVITEHYGGDAENRARACGRAIALLHLCLRECDHLSGFPRLDLVEQIREWAVPRIRTGGTVVDACAIERVWTDAGQEIVSLYSELPRQLIHRDPHPSNMLFDKGELTGFLDFEMVLKGPRVFDVCYCGSSMLVSGFQEPEKAQRWPELCRSLVRGYEEFCPLTPSEYRALYGLFVAIELIFIAYWLDTHAENAARSSGSMLYWLSTNRDALAIR